MNCLSSDCSKTFKDWFHVFVNYVALFNINILHEIQSTSEIHKSFHWILIFSWKSEFSRFSLYLICNMLTLSHFFFAISVSVRVSQLDVHFIRYCFSRLLNSRALRRRRICSICQNLLRLLIRAEIELNDFEEEFFRIVALMLSKMSEKWRTSTLIERLKATIYDSSRENEIIRIR